jgi:adenine-specific DNA-methyltransferase
MNDNKIVSCLIRAGLILSLMVSMPISSLAASSFVIDDKTIEDEKLEEDIIKPWIKSSCIEKGNVHRNNLKLIYSNLIEDEEDYPNCIRHIRLYKNKLELRRECKNGIRLWYQLQWGRVQNIFEAEKIVFPYKSNNNRFSIDKGSYFSADVYCLELKENSPFTYHYLIQILNSKVYEYYFKTFAKKLGEDLYEYYPNNLMKLCIPTMMDLGKDVDKTLYSFFDFNDSEIEIINKYTFK